MSRVRQGSPRRATVACLLLLTLAVPGLRALGGLLHPHAHPVGHHLGAGDGWTVEPFDHARHDDLQIEPARRRELEHCAICVSHLRPGGSLAASADFTSSQESRDWALPAALPAVGSRSFSPRQSRGPPTV